MVAAGSTAITGDLSKGLMAGLGAFGGAGLAGAAGVGGSLLGGNAGGLLGNNPGLFGAEMGFGAGAKTAASAIPGAGVGEAIKVTGQIPGAGALSAAAPEALTPAIQSAVQGPLSSQIANQAVNQAASNIGQVATQGLAQGAGQATANALPSGGLFSKFGGYTKQGLGGAPKILSKNAPMLAGIGALSSVAGAMQPSMPTYDEDEENSFEYKGPFVPGKREVSFQSDEDMRASGGAEYMGFTPSNPQPRRVADLTPEERTQYGFAEGGSAMVAPYSRFGSDTISPSSSMIVPAELSAPSATRAELPAYGDLKAAMDFFGATSPGAITASMRPTTPVGVTGSEAKYEFNKRTNPVPPIMGGGNFDFGGFDLSNLAGLDINGLANQYGYYQNTGQDSVAPTLTDTYEPLGQIDFGSGGNDRFNPPSAPPIMTDFNGANDLAGRFQNTINEPLGQVDSQFDMPPPANSSVLYEPLGQIDFGSGGDDRFNRPAAMRETPYTLPAYEDFQQYAPPVAQEPQYNPPAMQDFQQLDRGDYFSTPAMQDFQQYTPPAMQDFQQYAPPAMQEAQYVPYAPPAYEDFQYAPPSIQESVYDYGQDMGGFSGGKRERNTYEDEYARGGEVDMRDGSFVVDARTVSELGNGSSNAGMELLARMGGRPLQGPGDGVSDSIRARIGGKQEARVARDEVLFSPEAVKRLGKGSEKRGTAKLYDLMNKAHKARKKAKRGQDTKVRKGLA
jgi:hypothetical protein